MSDGGISITGLTIGGAALTAIGGMVGAWIRSRYGRTEIRPQPLEVRDATNRALTDHVQDNRSDHSNIFSRLSSVEQRVAAVESSYKAQELRLTSIDGKLDKILERVK
jgi:hypothetical protein